MQLLADQINKHTLQTGLNIIFIRTDEKVSNNINKLSLLNLYANNRLGSSLICTCECYILASASSQNNKTQYANTLSKKYFVGLSIQQLAACMVQLDSTQVSSVFRSLTGFKNHYRVPTLVPCDGPYNENRTSLTEKLILARCLGFRLMVELHRDTQGVTKQQQQVIKALSKETMNMFCF